MRPFRSFRPWGSKRSKSSAPPAQKYLIHIAIERVRITIRVMANRRYVLRHEILGAGRADGWSKDFPTLQDARHTADEQWWTADARAVRQTIVESSTGKEEVRRADGTWMAVPKKIHLRN